MNKLRRRKLFHMTIMLIGVGMSVSLALYALRQNISLYYTPTQLYQQKIAQNALIRIGGIVATHSVSSLSNTTTIQFAVTDSQHTVWVRYKGILPALFGVGQGVVVQGYLQKNGIFLANQVLAKHGSYYHAA